MQHRSGDKKTVSHNRTMEKPQDFPIESRLFIFVLNLAIPFILFFNRGIDDNRLTSWNWVFTPGNIISFGIPLSLILVLVWILSTGTFYEKRKGLFLFAVSFIMGSCFWSEPEVIVDSSRYFTQAKQLRLYGLEYFAAEWGREIFAWTDLPVMPFLYGLVFRILGEQRIFIQALNTIFFSLTVVLTFRLGRALWHEDLGFRAGLLLLGIPYLYTQVPLLLVDVPTMFFFMLSVVACINALKYGGAVRIVQAGLAIFLVFYVKFSGWLLLTLIPVLFAYYIYKDFRPALKRGLALSLVASILIGLFFLIYREVLWSQIEFLVEYQKPGLKSWSEGYISTYFFQIHPLITVAVLFAVGAAVRKTDFRFILISFIVLLFFIMQVKRIRYTLPVFPMLALMAAYGLETLSDKKLTKHLVLSIAATSFVIAYTGYLPFLKSLGVQNLQEAGEFLDSIPGNEVEVVSFAGENAVINPVTAVPTLDIYTTKELMSDLKNPRGEVLDRYKKSPLRFTWEYPLPDYYLPKSTGDVIDALVIISDTIDPVLSPGLIDKISLYPREKFFHQSSHIFQHQTYVTVYHK